MLSHLKELQADKRSYGHVDSAVDMSPGGYVKTPSSLNDVEEGGSGSSALPAAQEQQQQQQQNQNLSPRLNLSPNQMTRDPVERSLGDEQSERETDKIAHDAQFRVNGIVVDHEVKGGARRGWEGVYEIMFRSSTSMGQRVALVLLVMVSVSVAVGECIRCNLRERERERERES